MIILRIILFLIVLLFSVVILGILKIFASLIVRILLGKFIQNARSNRARAGHQGKADKNPQKQDQLVACAACSTYISASSAVKVNDFGKERLNGWVCKSFRNTKKICK